MHFSLNSRRALDTSQRKVLTYSLVRLSSNPWCLVHFFFVLHSATKVTQCPRKRIGKLPQCCWMPSSEETGALVLIFFLDVVGSVCHSRCVSLFSVQCSHRCGPVLICWRSVPGVVDSCFCLEMCLKFSPWSFLDPLSFLWKCLTWILSERI